MPIEFFMHCRGQAMNHYCTPPIPALLYRQRLRHVRYVTYILLRGGAHAGVRIEFAKARARVRPVYRELQACVQCLVVPTINWSSHRFYLALKSTYIFGLKGKPNKLTVYYRYLFFVD